MNYRDIDRLELILELIGHLHRRLDGLDRERFLSDRDEIDLTAYRLSVIGETCSKLGEHIKARNGHIPWVSIYGMRNVIVHDYEGVVAQRLWATFEQHIDTLAEVCGRELEDASQ